MRESQSFYERLFDKTFLSASTYFIIIFGPLNFIFCTNIWIYFLFSITKKRGVHPLKVWSS